MTACGVTCVHFQHIREITSWNAFKTGLQSPPKAHIIKLPPQKQDKPTLATPWFQLGGLKPHGCVVLYAHGLGVPLLLYGSLMFVHLRTGWASHIAKGSDPVLVLKGIVLSFDEAIQLTTGAGVWMRLFMCQCWRTVVC